MTSEELARRMEVGEIVRLAVAEAVRRDGVDPARFR